MTEATRPARVDAAAIEHAPVAIVITDLGGIILDCNRHAETLYGLTREQLIGANSMKFAVDTVEPDLMQAIWNKLVAGETWEGDFRVSRADGSIVDVHSIDSALLDADGRVEGVVSVSTDVTERRRQERRLAAQYAATRVLAEAETLSDAIAQILPVVCEVLGWQAGALWEIADDGETLRCVESWSAPGVPPNFAEVSRRIRLPPGMGMPGRVWARREATWLADVVSDKNFPRADAAAASGLHGAFAVPVRTGDEFLGVLEFFGSSVEEPDQQLLDMMDSVGFQVGQFIRRRRAESELRAERQRLTQLAATLQESLLPAELPHIRGVELAAAYHPAGEGERVAGDFYDVFERARGDWSLVIGDVCGKGPEAAALTALARYTVRAAAMQTARPSAILALLNDAILRQHPERFCTAVYARTRVIEGTVRLTVAVGGHPLPLRVGADGTVEPVGIRGRLLGVTDEYPIGQQTIDLSPGDAVVFYTDGLTDARRDDERFGEPRLHDTLRSFAGASASEIVRRLEEEVAGFENGERADDLAVVVVRSDPSLR